MAKKDTATAVLGMLSAAGSQTRPAAGIETRIEAVRDGADPGMPRRDEAPPPQPVAAPLASAAPLAPEPSRQGPPATGEAPRTLRLRADTAASLRSAWLAAKRDDVLLTAQDFASDLVEQALRLRARSQQRASVGGAEAR